MKSINKAAVMGYVGANPATYQTPEGNNISAISVATNEKWKDKRTGQIKEKTMWHRVVFFNGLAETANQYLKKGSKVYVEGKLNTRKWFDKDGVQRYTVELIGKEMIMLDKKDSEATDDTEELSVNSIEIQQENDSMNYEDIPF